MVFTISRSVDLVENGNAIKKCGVLRPFFVSLIVCMPFLTRSIQGYYIKMLPEQNLISHRDIPWSDVAYSFATTIMPSLICWMTSKHGKKTMSILLSVIQILPCICFFFNATQTQVILANVFYGTTTAIAFIVLPIYVKEMNEHTYKISIISVFIMIEAIATNLLQFSVKSHEDTWLYVMLVLILLQLIGFLSLQETPCFYVNINDYEKTAQCLAKLNGSDEKDELTKSQLNKLREEAEKALFIGDKNLRQILKHKPWRQGAKIGSVILTCYTLSGAVLFLKHEDLLKTADIVNEKLLDDILPILMLAVSFITIALVTVVEVKYIIATSFAILSVSLGIFGVFIQSDMISTAFWLPVVSLASIHVGYYLGHLLPYVLLVLVFNFKVTTKVISLLFTCNEVLRCIHIHTFPYIQDFIGLHTFIYIFAGINMYGAVFTLFAVPGIKKKTLKEIEKKLNIIPIWKQ